MGTYQRQGQSVDLADLMNNGRFSPVQFFIIIMIALVVALDGFDSQLLGYALPQIMQDWGLERSVFTFAVMASSLGMVAGSALAGLLADRIGRRRVILITLALCAIATCLVGTAAGTMEIALYRFVAGFGIGGALPVCTTMAAEFAPRRHRTMVITATIVCVPLGGLLAGFFSNTILYTIGWRQAFYIGGMMPLLILVLLFFTLPESPYYLARFSHNQTRLRRLMRRLRLNFAENAVIMDGQRPDTAKQKAAIGALLQRGLARDTIALWCVFFFCMIDIYAVFGWLPTLLTAENIGKIDAGRSLMAYNLGGVAGAFLCALTISRLGSKRGLIVFALFGALTAFIMLAFDLKSHISFMLVFWALHGMFADGLQSPLYALAAFLYPTAIRATGTASAAACGRAGALLAGLAGGVISGFTVYLLVLGASMLCVLAALACIRRHMPAVKAAGSRDGLAVAE